MENTETKSCPLKSFFCSTTILVFLACLACFFIGYFVGSKPIKVPQVRNANPYGILPARQFKERPSQPKVVIPKVPQRSSLNTNSQNTKSNIKPVSNQQRTNTAKANALRTATAKK